MFLPPSLKLGSYKLDVAHKLLKVLNYQNMIQYFIMAKNKNSRVRLSEFKNSLCHCDATIGKLFHLFMPQFLQL